MCNFVHSSTFTELYNHHHDLMPEHFHKPKRNTYPIEVIPHSSPHSIFSSRKPQVYLKFLTISLFVGLHINIIHTICSLLWLAFSFATFSWLIHVIPGVSISFLSFFCFAFFLTTDIPFYQNTNFTYPLMSWRALSCSPFLFYMDNAATEIHLQVFVLMYILIWLCISTRECCTIW